MEEPQGNPWEEAIQAQPRGVAFPLQVLTPFGILSPLLSLLLLGKASHLPGTSMSSAEPVQQGSYDTAWVQMPASLPVLSDLMFLGREVHLPEPQFPHQQNGAANSSHLGGPCNHEMRVNTARFEHRAWHSVSPQACWLSLLLLLCHQL